VWREFLERVIVSFAAANPEAYFYYLCYRHESLTEFRDQQGQSSPNMNVISLGDLFRYRKPFLE
jgi:hypothetical protein